MTLWSKELRWESIHFSTWTWSEMYKTHRQPTTQYLRLLALHSSHIEWALRGSAHWKVTAGRLCEHGAWGILPVNLHSEIKQKNTCVKTQSGWQKQNHHKPVLWKKTWWVSLWKSDGQTQKSHTLQHNNLYNYNEHQWMSNIFWSPDRGHNPRNGIWNNPICLVMLSK